MIEILITILIVGFGLLGVAQMQINSLKAVNKGSDTTEAVFLANFILDRIKTVPPPSSAYPVHASNYDTGSLPLGEGGKYDVDKNTGKQTGGPTKQNCTRSEPCNLEERIIVDLWQWDGMLQGVDEKVENESGKKSNTGGLVAGNGCIEIQNNQIRVSVGWCALGGESQLDLDSSDTCITSKIKQEINNQERTCSRRQVNLNSVM